MNLTESTIEELQAHRDQLELTGHALMQEREELKARARANAEQLDAVNAALELRRTERKLSSALGQAVRIVPAGVESAEQFGKV